MTHGAIEPAAQEPMRKLATVVDTMLNGPRGMGLDRRWGFVVLVAEFGRIEGGRVNYISNGERDDMVAMLREYLARLEGRVAETPETPQ